jgi:hypothetical protein
MSDFAKPLQVFATSDLLLATILFIRHRHRLKYIGCHYHFDCDQYRFWFRDDEQVGPSIVKTLDRDSLVPAGQFRRALARLHRDFQEQQRRNGNPNSAAAVSRSYFHRITHLAGLRHCAEGAYGGKGGLRIREPKTSRTWLRPP